MNNTYNINLFCNECDHPDCRIGDYVRPESKQGCVRQVSEDLYISYYHQLKEVWPMVANENYKTVKQEYINTINILNKIYACPIVRQYGHSFVPKILEE